MYVIKILDFYKGIWSLKWILCYYLYLYDVFLEYFTPKEIDKKISDGILEIFQLAYMRGRTLKNC